MTDDLIETAKQIAEQFPDSLMGDTLLALLVRIKRIEDERDSLKARRNNVLDLHRPITYDGMWCSECVDVDTLDNPGATAGAVQYPCPTVVAVMGDDLNG